MTWTNGGLFVANYLAALSGGQALNLTLTSHKIALFTTTLTPDYTVSAANSAYGAGVWASNEVSGGTYTAGGWVLSTGATGGGSMAPTVTQNPSGTLMYDMNDLEKLTQTFSGARGALLYADSLTPKIGICAVPFGADYGPNNGTFTIQWPTAGVFAIDITP